MSSRLTKPYYPAPAETPEDVLVDERKTAREQRERKRKFDEASVDLEKFNAVRAKKVYAKSTLRDFRRTVDNFGSFTEQVQGMSKSDEGHGRRYFDPGHLPPTVPTIQKFLGWYAYGGGGKGLVASCS
ncbi:unnamed protein product [Calypogeia fissa]